MDVVAVINEVRGKVAHMLPRDITFDDIVEENKQEIIDVVMEKVAHAMEQAILGAQSVLKTQSDDYINGLKLGSDLSIEIDESVKYLEEGYDRHPMLENLLTGPKSKIAKDGSLYNTIPIGKKKKSDTKRAMGNQADNVLSKGWSIGTSMGKLEDIVKNMTATINSTSDTPSHEATGFAVASSKQDAASKWVHPGFEGVNQLYYINTQLRYDMVEAVSLLIERAVRWKEY